MGPRVGSAFSAYKTLKIGNLNDVTITTATNNDILQYNSATGKWENRQNVTIGNNLTVTNNLTVNGTTTSVVNQTTTGTVTINITSTTALSVNQTGGGTNALTVDTTNRRVGVGTNAPGSDFQVNQQTQGTDFVILRRAGGGQGRNTGILFKDQVGTALAAIGMEGNVTNDLQILSGAAIRFNTSSDLIITNERMRIDGSGNVGIGTTGPKSALDVNGGVAIGTYAGVTAAPSNSLIVSGKIGIGVTSIDAASLLQVNGTIVVANNTGYDSFDSAGSNRSILFLDNSNPDILYLRNNQRGNGGVIAFDSKSGAGESMRIDSSGNVGIAMTPVRTLDVTGTFGATGAATLGSTLVVGGNLTFSTNDTFNIGLNGGTRPSAIYLQDVGGVNLRRTADNVNMGFFQGGLVSLWSSSTANYAGITGVSGVALGTTSPTYTMGVNASQAFIKSTSAQAFAVGRQDILNPAFSVDSSVALQAAGLNVVGAIAAGTVAVAVISSGAAANLTVDALGTGTIGIGTVSTGNITLGQSTALSKKITTYNNIATAGWGVPTVYGLDNRTGLTGVDGAAITLYTTVAANNIFRISADIFATAAVTGTATYTIAWTENATAQTMVTTATAINVLGTVSNLIRPDNATTITAKLTGTFTGTFTVAGLVEQVA